jgi:hypothetical protein
MVSEVLRPRAIERPCVIQVKTGTNWDSRRSQGTMCGKADSDDIPVGRQTRVQLKKPYAVLEVPARTARAVPVLDRTTGKVLPVSRPWAPWKQESVVAHRPWTAPHAWNPSQQVRLHRAPATCGQALPASPRPLPSPSLRWQTVPGLRSMGAEAMRNVNHTVRLAICVSAQHGFVGQVWSGPGVGLCPTRCPLRLSRHVPAHGCRAGKGDTLPCTGIPARSSLPAARRWVGRRGRCTRAMVGGRLPGALRRRGISHVLRRRTP